MSTWDPAATSALRSALTKAQRGEMKSRATEDFLDVESLGWRGRGCQKS
jgi:hypothetical protein